MSEFDLDAWVHDPDRTSANVLPCDGTTTYAYMDDEMTVSGCQCGHHHDETGRTQLDGLRHVHPRADGPFTGRHEHQTLMLTPPDWDLSPAEYRSLAAADVPQSGKVVAGSASLTAIGAGTFWGVIAMPGPAQDVDAVLRLAASVGLPMSIGALAATLFTGLRYVRWRHHDRSGLAHRDPAEAISPIGLPSEVYEVLVRLADVGELRSAEERRERLGLAYNYARQFCDALQGTSGSLYDLVERCPQQISDLLALTLQDNKALEHVKGAAHTLNLHWTVYRSDNPTLTSATTFSAEPSLQAQWDTAIETHDRVVEEWADIVTDPLAALEHSLLLDVTQPRTATFIDAYGQAQDLRAVIGTTCPTGPDARTRVREYLSAVRKANTAWADASRHAAHVNLRWLPEAEATSVRRASVFLAVAADETATLPERAAAASKAAALLAEVTSFVLPAEAMRELETTRRLALNPGPVNTASA